MATPTNEAERASMRATARRLATQGASQRAIARQLGIHHKTVGAWLAEDTAPEAPQAPHGARQAAPPATRQAPPAPATTAPVTATWTPPPLTSGDRWYTELLRRPPAWLVQDLNMLLLDGIPEHVARAIHAAADERRATERATEDAIDRQAATGARHDAPHGGGDSTTCSSD